MHTLVKINQSKLYIPVLDLRNLDGQDEREE